MPDENVPPIAPSRRTLFRSTMIAVATALLILVTVVLPAEYGIDPTRIGRLLGLTRMGEIKAALAREAAADAAADRAAEASDTTATDTSAVADTTARKFPE